MGKINRSSSSKTFVHKKNHNPQARESIERKTIALQNIEIKRLQSKVAIQRKNLESFLSTDDKELNAKSITIDPQFKLKGAARIAQEHYLPPNYQKLINPENLLSKFAGRLWENEDGRQLLHSMLQLGVALHGSAALGKTKEAVATFQEMIELDGIDHLLARHQLLRCYLDQGEAGKARQLLDQWGPSDSSSCFSFSRALIEHISWTVLQEPGSSEALRDEELAKAIALNPYSAWTIAYHEIFGDAVDHFELLGADYQLLPSSVEEALLFFNVDVPLWRDTEGAVEWVRSYLCHNRVRPPAALLSPGEPSSSEEQEHHAMFLGMFHTAMEMIEEEEGREKGQERADPLNTTTTTTTTTTKLSCPRIDSGGNRRAASSGGNSSSSSSSDCGGNSNSNKGTGSSSSRSNCGGSRGKVFFERRKRR